MRSLLDRDIGFLCWPPTGRKSCHGSLNRQSQEREVVLVSRVSFGGGRKRAAHFLVAGFEAVAEVDQDRQWDLDRRPLTGAIGV